MINVESTIDEIKREKNKLENSFDIYKNNFLRDFRRKLESILEEYHLLTEKNEQVLEDVINSIKIVINSNEDILNGSLTRNIQLLNRKNEGEVVNLNEQINSLDEVANHVKKHLDAHIDSTEIGYRLTKELGIRENENVRYEISRMTVRNVEKLKDELIPDITKMMNTIIEHNVTLRNIERANEIENTPELIVITTTEEKKYTVEKIGDQLTLRPYKLRDDFDANQHLYGEEADILYKNLKLEENIVEENLNNSIQVEEISDNRKAFK